MCAYIINAQLKRVVSALSTKVEVPAIFPNKHLCIFLCTIGKLHKIKYT